MHSSGIVYLCILSNVLLHAKIGGEVSNYSRHPEKRGGQSYQDINNEVREKRKRQKYNCKQVLLRVLGFSL